MSINMSRVKLALFIITIMISNIAAMGEMVITPIINNWYETYFESINVVSMIISVPALALILASLCTPLLLRVISKKTLLIIGGILFAVSGIFGAAVDNVWYIFALRIPYGIGIAFVNVSAISFIAEVFAEDSKRASIMGLYNAFMAGIGAIMSFVAGHLALSDWRMAYNTYWLAVPMVIMFILFLPYIKPNSVQESSEQANVPKIKEPFGKQFWIFAVATIFFNIAYIIQMIFISTYVAENALGDAALAGTLAGIGTIGSFLFCLIFGKIYAKIGKNVILIYFTAVLIGSLLLWLLPSLIVTYIVIFLCGGAYGSALSYAYAYSSMIVPMSKIDGAIGVITAAISLGMFLAPYFATMTMGFLGSFMVTPVFGIAAIIVAISIVLVIIGNSRERKQLQ